MNKGISQKLKISRILAILILLLGIVLVTYMIKVEDEPGALPLLLIVVGIVWLIANQLQIRKTRSS